MAIKRVWIEPGCILCHSGAGLCPAVFEVSAELGTAVVKQGVDYAPHEDDIRMAAQNCPVQVIKYEEDE